MLQTGVPPGVCRNSGSLVRLPTRTTRLIFAMSYSSSPGSGQATPALPAALPATPGCSSGAASSSGSAYSGSAVSETAVMAEVASAGIASTGAATAAASSRGALVREPAIWRVVMSRCPPFPWSRCRPRLPAPLGTERRDDGAGSVGHCSIEPLMRRLFAWIGGTVGGIAAYRFVRRQEAALQTSPEPVAAETDARAEELRTKLAQAREPEPVAVEEPVAEPEPVTAEEQDRKSTRLNSSH